MFLQMNSVSGHVEESERKQNYLRFMKLSELLSASTLVCLPFTCLLSRFMLAVCLYGARASYMSSASANISSGSLTSLRLILVLLLSCSIKVPPGKSTLKYRIISCQFTQLLSFACTSNLHLSASTAFWDFCSKTS